MLGVRVAKPFVQVYSSGGSYILTYNPCGDKRASFFIQR